MAATPARSSRGRRLGTGILAMGALSVGVIGVDMAHSSTSTTSLRSPCPRRVLRRAPPPERFVRWRLDELDRSASRFRADSELSRFNTLSLQAARENATQLEFLVTPLFAAALRTAALTDGLVVPTLGGHLVTEGYDADIDEVRTRSSSGTPASTTRRRAPEVPPLPLLDGRTLTTVAGTAAIILGDAAVDWLEERGVPARLQAVDGIVVRTSLWGGDA